MAKELFNFKKPPRRPPGPVPSYKTDLFSLTDDSLVWFGHSSVFLRLKGCNILIDPVLSPRASPFFFLTRAFPGTDIYRPQDIPNLDCILITHDHYDHLDYPTIMALKDRVGHIVCPLGAGAHLKFWGIDSQKIIELDWEQTFTLQNNLKITGVQARHFSGRTFKWNQALWAGFILQTDDRNIYCSGDGGFGSHFGAIGQRGPFDLAIVECGQYDRRWASIHLTPEETVQAALLVKARALMPVHAGKFCISYHGWDEPYKRFLIAVQKTSLQPVTPKIGQKVNLADPFPTYEPWWTAVTAKGQ
jgi:L-ascorbate metabolism protein UlaG (beta-lactamase superfamily)